MKVTTDGNDTMNAEPNDVTSTIANKDSSSEPDNLTTSTAQKDSSSNHNCSASVELSGTVVPSPSNVQAVDVPTSTVQTANISTLTVVPVCTRPFKPVTGSGTANNADARRLVIPNTTLHFNAIDAAIGDGLMGRQSITIENDDVAVVKIKANSQVWVNKLVSAFTVDYLATPEDTSRTSSAQQEWFTRWQKQAHATLVTIINGKDPKHLEKSCWFLLRAVFNAHELGIVDAGGNLNASKMKCSQRLASIVSILEKYALVRLDVLRAWHVDEIAANPEAFIKRKLLNCWNNANRAEKAKEEKAKKVAGTKRKARKSVEQDEESEVQTPAKAKRTRKSKVDDDAKTNGKTKTSTKHPRTAPTPDSDDEESTPTKRSATRKAPSRDAVNNNDDHAVDDMDEY